MKDVLNASYEKEWTGNFLLIGFDHSPDTEYQGKMLYYNDVPGIIRYEDTIKEGSTYYKYPVTGKKPLTAVFQTLPIREWHLRKIIGCIIESIENAKEFLLSEEDIILIPDYVYVNISDYSAEVILLPGHSRPLKDGMEGLLEYMLNRVDYDDKGAVELIYDCYVLALKDGNIVQAIKERLERDGQIKGVTEIKPEPEKSLDTYPSGKEEVSGVNKLKEWIKSIFKKTDKDDSSFEIDIPDIDSPKVSLVDDEDRGTVLLSRKSLGGSPHLISMATGEIVKLSSPFTVGSLAEHMDLSLYGEGVSRMHAKLYENDGQWFLADLNSTNGTYKNEVNVMPGVDVELVTNDRIRFATEEFVFKGSEV